MLDEDEWDPRFGFPMVGDVVTPMLDRQGLIGVVREVRRDTVVVLTSIMGLERSVEWPQRSLGYRHFKDLPSSELSQMPPGAIRLARKRQRDLDRAETDERHRERVKKAIEDCKDLDLVDRLTYSAEALEEFRVHFASSNDPGAIDFLLEEELRWGAASLPDSSRSGVESDEYLRIVARSGLIAAVRLGEDGDLVVSRIIVPSSKVTSIDSAKSRRRRRKKRKAA